MKGNLFGEDKFPESNLAHNQLTTLHADERMRASCQKGDLCITTRLSGQIYSGPNWLLVFIEILITDSIYNSNIYILPLHLDLQEEKTRVLLQSVNSISCQLMQVLEKDDSELGTTHAAWVECQQSR